MAEQADVRTIDDLAVRTSVQSQRITTIDTSLADLRRDTATQIQGINATLGALASKIDERFNAIAATMAERNKTQWPVIWSAIGVSFAVFAYIFTQNLTPIKESQSDLKDSVTLITQNMVTQAELKWRTDRSVEDRTRMNESLIYLRDNTVTRNEWSERSRTLDVQMTDLGRRIDDISKAQGEVYGTRDIIQDLKAEILDLRNQYRRLSSARVQ